MDEVTYEHNPDDLEAEVSNEDNPENLSMHINTVEHNVNMERMVKNQEVDLEALLFLAISI